MKSGTRWGAAAAAAIAATFIQCGSEKGSPETGRCEGAVPDRVVYPDERRASDEALERVWVDRCDASTDPAQAYVLISPADAATVPADQPVELRWGRALASAAPAGIGRPARLDAPAFGWPSISFGIPKAAAHIPPITGWVYLVELRPAAGGDPLYVFTADESWLPDEAEWAELRAMGSIDVTIWTAYLDKNVIYDAKDGPFVSPSPSRFTIGDR
ncbi:hypothetical protein [Vulgatibacter incomptus]|uniref:hypothetical protein n=1 Tax=Vulgatibacter incomptus TaxID=1391653 RepID=UPI001470575A|nr:hypothetical protein [Vulgatibacter incomptus]